jgi:hypothetical protein
LSFNDVFKYQRVTRRSPGKLSPDNFGAFFILLGRIRSCCLSNWYPYLKLLKEKYIADHRSNQDSNAVIERLTKLPDGQKNVFLSILKFQIIKQRSNRDKNWPTKSPSQVESDLQTLAESVNSNPLFDKICRETLLQHRRNEDMLRFYDYIAQSEKLWKGPTKADRRKKQDVVSIVRIDDALKSLGEHSRKRTPINSLQTFDITHNLDDVTKRMEALLKTLRLGSNFLYGYYEHLSDTSERLENFRQLKEEFDWIKGEVEEALSDNPKSEIMIDNFVYLTSLLVKKLNISRGNKSPSADQIRIETFTVCQLIGCEKGSSEENFKTIRSNAKQYCESKFPELIGKIKGE